MNNDFAAGLLLILASIFATIIILGVTIAAGIRILSIGG